MNEFNFLVKIFLDFIENSRFLKFKGINKMKLKIKKELEIY